MCPSAKSTSVLKKLAVGAALGLLVVAPADAGTASLVRDIAPGDLFGSFDVEPTGLFGGGSHLYFVGNLEDDGSPIAALPRALWVSDGTASGTQPLVGLCPNCSLRYAGRGGHLFFFFASERFGEMLLWRTDGTRAGTFPLTANGPAIDSFALDQGGYAFLGSTLFFGGEGTDGRPRLWRTDGTVEGTRLVAEISTGPFGAIGLGSLTAFAGQIYFVAPRETDGALVVWRSDGSAAGTVALAGNAWNAHLMTVAGSRLFFVATSGQAYQLWTTDGVAAPAPVTPAAGPFLGTRWLEVSGSRVFFVATDAARGQELWVSDGSSSGTRPVTDFANAMPLNDAKAAAVGERIVFSAVDVGGTRGVWSSAGTPRSTVRLLGSPPAFGSRFTAVGAHLLFFVDLGDFEGLTLWATDGTHKGTVPLKTVCDDFLPCPDPVVRVVGGVAFFAVGSPEDWFRLWRTDGTAAGTRRDEPVVAGFFLFRGPEIAPLGGELALVAGDADDGAELWVTDDSPEGRRQLTAAWGPLSSHPRSIVPLDEQILFVARPGADEALGLWRSTAAAAVPVPGPAGSASSLLSAGGKVFFVSGGEVWRFDVAGGPLQLTVLGPDRYLDYPHVLLPYQVFVPYQGGVAFLVRSAEGVSVWSSDGTPPGTGELCALPSPSSGEIDVLYEAAGALFYTTIDRNQFVSKLWHTDGTTAGSQELARLPFQAEPQVTRVGDWFYFRGTDGVSSFRAKLWRTDGAPANTSQVALSGGGEVDHLVAAGPYLFFLQGDPQEVELVRYEVASGELSLGSFTRAERPVGNGGEVVFAADDDEHGMELWASDGTSAGTRLVRDISIGRGQSLPGGLTAAAGLVFFVADDGRRGAELWQSDGTESGTRLVQDLNPGPAGSRPSGFTPAGGTLFFAADDGVVGEELWALPLAGSGCVKSPQALCLQGGRYKVEAFWRDFGGGSGPGRGVALTPDTGYFWFFDPANVELMVKLLDGAGVNGHQWVFYGALSSVEYAITVTDTLTGASRRYLNPPGALASVGDTTAFGPRGASAAGGVRAIVAWSSSRGRTVIPRTEHGDAVAPFTCVETATRLCLRESRFAVDVAWSDFAGNSGTGQGSGLSGDTGTFWFFTPSNVELVVKILDGTPLNGKYWVFFGALSSVEYVVTVTDSATGEQRVYRNPSGRLASVADTSAF